MVQLRDAATVSGPTTSDGIVILTVQRASGPHPHPAGPTPPVHDRDKWEGINVHSAC